MLRFVLQDGMHHGGMVVLRRLDGGLTEPWKNHGVASSKDVREARQ